MANTQVNGLDVSKSPLARTTATAISANINPATWNRMRALDHRRSQNAPSPAPPSTKIAPITLEVNRVRVQGQILMAAEGARNRNALVTRAATPTTPMSRAVPAETCRPATGGLTRSRRFAHHTAKTRNG